jgi:hypothetical protein
MANTATVEKLSKAQLAFMAWLQAKHPNIYQRAVPDNAGLSGIIDSITAGFNSVMNNAGSLLSSYVTGKSQLDLLKLNIQRAKAGLPPQTADEQALMRGASTAAPSFLSQIPPVAWIGAGGLLLWFILRRK